MAPTISTLQEFIATCEHPTCTLAPVLSCSTSAGSTTAAAASTAPVTSDTSSDTSSDSNEASTAVKHAHVLFSTSTGPSADRGAPSQHGDKAAPTGLFNAAWDDGDDDLDLDVAMPNDCAKAGTGAVGAGAVGSGSGLGTECEYPDSSQRLVYMSKYVVAVQLQQRTGDGGNSVFTHQQEETEQENERVVCDLGVAVFGRENEETQFVSALLLFPPF